MIHRSSLCLIFLCAGLASCTPNETKPPPRQHKSSTVNASATSNSENRRSSTVSAIATSNPAEQVAAQTNPQLAEISGLVPSLIDTNRLWVANDSGNASVIHALNLKGELQQSVSLAIDNRDWEDLGVLAINKESYVLVADIGDNLKRHSEYSIYFFNESRLLAATSQAVEPTATLRFRYEDGSHNAEAMFSDGTYLYLLTKERLEKGKAINGGVYRIDLDLSNSPTLLIAKRIATLALPSRSVPSRFLARLAGIDMEQPTAAMLASDASTLYVLTYRNVLMFQRQGNETWAEALSRSGRRVVTHDLPQAEALGVSDNGDVWVMSEKLPAQLWRFAGHSANFPLN